MKKYLLLLALVCLLGNRVLAQNRGVMKQVTETIDFTVTKQSGNPNVNFGFNSNNNPMINNQVVSERITVDNTGYWQFWGSDAYHESYLQKNTNSNTSYVYLSGLNVDDIVTIWGEVGNNQGSIPGAYNITSGATLLNTTYFEYNGNNLPDSKQYRITEAGTATIQVDGNYSGIRKITIQYQVRAEDYFNYDPGYEDYDMYDEFSENDPKKWRHGQELNPHQWSTSYTLSEEETGITLNGQTAQYIVLSGSKITANNRIAIDGNAGDWRFNYGLRAPNNGKWANFSICNLKEKKATVLSFHIQELLRYSQVLPVEQQPRKDRITALKRLQINTTMVYLMKVKTFTLHQEQILSQIGIEMRVISIQKITKVNREIINFITHDPT